MTSHVVETLVKRLGLYDIIDVELGMTRKVVLLATP